MTTKEREKLVIQYHHEGYSVMEIAKKTDSHKSTIHRMHKRLLLIPNKRRLVKYTEKEKKEMIELYLQNKTIEEIQVHFPHLKVDGINYMLRMEGLTRRNGKRTYLNENYFEEIDTEAKAYFLGLLYADGSSQIQQKSKNGYSYTIRLELNIADRVIIEKLAEAVETNLKVKNFKRLREDGRERTTSYLQLTSKKMFDDLWKLGKRPMKVDTCLKIPDINQSLKNHFIRGYFDGDGTIYETGEKKYVRCAIYGTNSILNEIKNELSRNGIEVGHLKVHDKKDINVSLLTVAKKDTIVNLYNYIYKDASIYMERRKNKFDEVL